MNKHYRLGGFVLAAAMLIGMTVSAASVLEVAYPVAELNGCTDHAACRVYCADPAHTSACIDFGEKHGILTATEAVRAREAGKPGPGGCRGEDACRTYCQNPANQDECLAFALKSGRISRETHDLLKKAEADGGPGGCRNESACRTYCADVAHAEECLNFAEKNGLIKKDVALKARQLGVLEGPGGCRGKEMCRTYCANAEHAEECLAFAERHDLLAPREIAHARTLAAANGPGGCSGGGACRTYCADVVHTEECLAFAEKKGIAPKEEIARARKFLQATEQGGGPGGCTGEVCRLFCEKPENRDECLAFAKKNNLITSEQEAHIENGMKLRAVLVTMGGPGGCTDENMCRTYCGDPMHAEECTAFAVAHGGISREVAHDMLRHFIQQRSEARGNVLSSEEIDHETDSAEERFETFRRLEERFRPDNLPLEDYDDLSSDERDNTLPTRRAIEKGGFQGPNGGNSFRGPGGCSSPAACIRFCSEHADICSRPDKENTNGDEGDSGVHGDPRNVPFLERDGESSRVEPRLIDPKTLPPDFSKKTPSEQRDIINKLRRQLDSYIPPTEQSGGVGNQHPFGIPGRIAPPTTFPQDFRQQEYAPKPPPAGTNTYPAGSQEGHYVIPEKPLQVPVESPDYSSGSGFVRPEPSFPPLIPPVPPPPTTLPPETIPTPSDATSLPTSQNPLERFLASVLGFLWQ